MHAIVCYQACKDDRFMLFPHRAHARHARINHDSSDISSEDAEITRASHLASALLLRILLGPVLCVLLERVLIVLEFCGYVLLHRIVGLGFLQ